MASRVSGRGQITIDRATREQLGVRPGMVGYRREGEPPRVTAGDELEEAVMEAIAEERGQSGDQRA